MNSSVARLVAERLTSADDQVLAELFAQQRLSSNANPAASWRDFFDVAETLLQTEAVSAALSALPRDDLAALAAGARRETFTLTGQDGRARPEVIGRISDITPTPASTPVPADPIAAEHAAERAFTTLAALADILLAALRSPLARVAAGTIGASDRRSLVDQQVVSSPQEADVLVRFAETTGLMRGHDRRMFTTRAGSEWVQQSTPNRWAHLAERLRGALPAGLRTASGGWADPAAWPDAYPLDNAWPAKARGWTEFARLIGLVADGAPPTEPRWARPLREGAAADPDPLVALLPHEVDRVYLQNDLTAISPGTLAPKLDARLRTMATRESQAQASAYRFTEATLSRGLSVGESADSMRAFLAEVSLTGVPQPLDYLIERAAERHGLVRISREIGTGRTVVSSRDHDLLRTIAVDQALGTLGLVPADGVLISRADRDVAFWALSDARYPAVVIDDDGRILSPDRHRVAPDAEPRNDFAPVLARLRASQTDDSDVAWLQRELEGSIKDRSRLVVTVSMPDGSSRELTLEPTGLGGGRLRGRDAGADVERTLPVSLITAVRPA